MKKIIKIILGMTFMVIQNQLYSFTNVPSQISVSQTWNLAGSPYVISKTTGIIDGVTVTINPGVEIRFDTKNQLVVRGKLIAVGTNSSRIKFTNASLSFVGSFGAYNPVTDDGNKLEFCDFSGQGSQSKGILFDGTALKLLEAELRNCDYTFFSDVNPSKVWAKNCIFHGMNGLYNKFNQGFIGGSELSFDKCSFNEFRTITGAEKTSFTNCQFRSDVSKSAAIEFGMYAKKVEMSCNYIAGYTNGIEFKAIYGYDEFVFEFNTLDSSNALKFNGCGTNNFEQIQIHYNNFLNQNLNSAIFFKVCDPEGTYRNFDCRFNYWGDSKADPKLIHDYTDDTLMIAYKVDFSEYYSEKIVDCKIPTGNTFIFENKNLDKLVIIQNASSDYTFISLFDGTEFKYDIRDICGKVVQFDKEYKSKVVVNNRSLKTGLYVINIETADGGYVCKKFIVF